SITFTSQFASVIVKAVKTSAGGMEVVDVPKGTPFNEPAFGSTYTSITFIVLNTSNDPITTSAPYTYQSSGESTFQIFEVKYDDGNPEGFLSLPVGDTQMVYFTGVQGAELDSIRIALRRAGTMQTTVSRFVSSFNPSPLGQTLVPEFTVTSTDSTTVPYPVPYQNWVGVDLRSHNIDASTDFAVSLVIGNSTAPALMVSSEPDDGDYHSYTYVQATGQWTVYSDGNNPNNVFKYLVRAYASIGTPTSAEQVIELLPKSFALRQNFPNPFNPSTTIRYEIPEQTSVKLLVVDALGRVVTTLIDRVQAAGTYEALWDGKDFQGQPASTGVYFYRLETGSQRAIKKMVLLK
ncbi:MAG: T9SS type A sorting domain-containing protein, partial [Bacteroidota bacterium]